MITSHNLVWAAHGDGRKEKVIFNVWIKKPPAEAQRGAAVWCQQGEGRKMDQNTNPGIND